MIYRNNKKMKSLKLNHKFEMEKILKDTKYPLSRIQYQRFHHILSNKYQNKVFSINEFIKYLEMLIEKDKIDVITMNYCKNEEEREKYKVYLVSDTLCFYSKDNKTYEPIDSINLFKKNFNGKTPKEDDEYLIRIKYPILPERIGKSTCSCFVIDTNNNLYISPYRQDTIQHTFITDCEDVLSAGLIFCEKGKILYLENRAGHYLPPPDSILYIFKFLRDKSMGNVLNFFHKEFDVKRIKFSERQNDIINNREYGLNFFEFKEKTEKYINYELQLRNIIMDKYFKTKNS